VSSTSPAQAVLIDRGDGFIYDNVLGITWAQNANINGSDTSGNQGAWAAGYSQTHSTYGTFDDWRLPNMDVNGDGTIIDCTHESETACRDNELGYLRNQYGVQPGASGPFTDFQSAIAGAPYWSGTDRSNPFFSSLWLVFFQSGFNATAPESSEYPALAVRNGDVAFLPEPSTGWLFGLGLLGLSGAPTRAESRTPNRSRVRSRRPERGPEETGQTIPARS